MPAKLAPIDLSAEPPILRLTDPTEYVVFALDEQNFGIELQFVSSIRSYQSLVRIAKDGAYIEGVAIADGVIIPIVDMRKAAFGKKPTYDISTAVIIVNVFDHKFGLTVDDVMDVVGLTDDDMNPPGMRGSSKASAQDLVTGIATHLGRRLIVLDVRKLFPKSSFDLTSKESAGERSFQHDIN